MSRIVSFRQMKDGTREDYELLDESEKKYALGLPDRVLASLGKLDHSLEGYPVSRLAHSLQAATRALRDHALILSWLYSGATTRTCVGPPARNGFMD